jgi:predicted RNase H-like HicB family nuclease
VAEVIFLIEDAPEGGYTAKALGYSIYTQADTWEELKQAIQDAITCHFEEGQRPSLVRMHHVHDEVILV